MNDPENKDSIDSAPEEEDAHLAETNKFLSKPDEDSLEVSSFSLSESLSDSLELIPESAGPADAELMEPGATLGKYEIIKLLGRGGMGAVYLAFDPMIEREVAIKVLLQPADENSVAFGRFISEARSTGKLNHPNVVAIYDIGQTEKLCYIVMELVSGGSVSDFIERRQEIDWLSAIRIAANAADGLAAAHRAGLVHRDIKPENLMLTDEGVAKVVDFGLSKLVDAKSEKNLGLTTEGQVLGTPRYMSPEQFCNEVVDSRSDVYCLGGTLFALLTGQPPYFEKNNLMSVMRAHVDDPPPDPLAYNRELPAACREIVGRSMAKDPELRYQDIDEMASDLWDLYRSQHYGTGARAAQSYRPCEQLVIAEPSRMQAMMLAKQFSSLGIGSPQVCDRFEKVLEQCQSDSPDLIITAGQLAGLTGIEVIEKLCELKNLRNAVLVMNTTDDGTELLSRIRHSDTLAVVSKKTRAEKLVSELSACSYLEFGKSSTIEDGRNYSSLRLGIINDTSRLPEGITDLIRDANIFDFQVLGFEDLGSKDLADSNFDLLIALRNAGDSADDEQIYLDILSKIQPLSPVVAAVQIDGADIFLRAFHCLEFIATCHASLESRRWHQILEICMK